MPVTMLTTGVEDLDANLKQLAGPVAQRISRAAIKAGAMEVAKYQRMAAPVGPTGNLRKSIGYRADRASNGLVRAKAGINVGKQPVRGGTYKAISTHTRQYWQGAPHSHLVALGTKSRTRQRIGGKFRYLEPNAYHTQPPRSRSTGKMPANPFIRQAAASAAGPAQYAIRNKIAAGIAAEVNRIGQRTGHAVSGVQ